MCPLLKFLTQHGNTRVYQWRTGKIPDRVEEVKLSFLEEEEETQEDEVRREEKREEKRRERREEKRREKRREEKREERERGERERMFD